jgi:hypothetical protein
MSVRDALHAAFPGSDTSPIADEFEDTDSLGAAAALEAADAALDLRVDALEASALDFESRIAALEA